MLSREALPCHSFAYVGIVDLDPIQRPPLRLQAIVRLDGIRTCVSAVDLVMSLGYHVALAANLAALAPRARSMKQ